MDAVWKFVLLISGFLVLNFALISTISNPFTVSLVLAIIMGFLGVKEGERR